MTRSPIELLWTAKNNDDNGDNDDDNDDNGALCTVHNDNNDNDTVEKKLIMVHCGERRHFIFLLGPNNKMVSSSEIYGRDRRVMSQFMLFKCDSISQSVSQVGNVFSYPS